MMPRTLRKGCTSSGFCYAKTAAQVEAFIFPLPRRTADLFHTVSNFSAERLSHFFPQIKSRIRVVHNGVTPLFFEPVLAVGRRYLIEHDLIHRTFILVPGGLHYRKNAEANTYGCGRVAEHVSEFRDRSCK